MYLYDLHSRCRPYTWMTLVGPPQQSPPFEAYNLLNKNSCDEEIVESYKPMGKQCISPCASMLAAIEGHLEQSLPVALAVDLWATVHRTEQLSNLLWYIFP